jgi:hypothetical protein
MLPLITKRRVLGQWTICNRCCCGDTDRGYPGVPVEWLKEEWRRRSHRTSFAVMRSIRFVETSGQK